MSAFFSDEYYMLSYLSKRSMGRSLCRRHSLGFSCISKSRLLRWIFRDYPVHHGKLNLRQYIDASSGSRDSVFTIAGVTYEGPKEVDSLRQPTSLMYYSRDMGWG